MIDATDKFLNQKEIAITSLMRGEGPTIASKRANVNRATIYNWLKDASFAEEMKIRKAEITTGANAFILNNVTSNIDRLQKLAEDSKDSRTQIQALVWLLEKSLGKTTQPIGIENNIDKDAVSIDVLDAEMTDFDAEDEE